MSAALLAGCLEFVVYLAVQSPTKVTRPALLRYCLRVSVVTV